MKTDLPYLFSNLPNGNNLRKKPLNQNHQTGQNFFGLKYNVIQAMPITHPYLKGLKRTHKFKNNENWS